MVKYQLSDSLAVNLERVGFGPSQMDLLLFIAKKKIYIFFEYLQTGEFMSKN